MIGNFFKRINVRQLSRHNPLEHFCQTKRSKPLRMSEKFLCPVARGMKKLDRDFFKKDVNLLIAKFSNPKAIGEFVRICKNYVLNVPQLKHIITFENTKAVIFKDDIDDINTYRKKLPQNVLDFIDHHNIQILPYKLALDYSFWKADDILQAILPESLLSESPSGYAQAGHIAHMNLRNEFKPYGAIIGQIILDKNPTIKTVVDKLDTISNEYRVFDMKLLAGENNFITEQHESGCRFRFDFSKTFWNSRLSTEHERLIASFKQGEVVGDVFAGVGPFSVPAGKKGVIVLANDLNPESHKYLVENAKLNNVLGSIKSFNLDGREFIRQSPRFLMEWKNKVGSIDLAKNIKRRRLPPESKKLHLREDVVEAVPIPNFISHYVMNLPGTSLEFLNEFVGLYSRDSEVLKLVNSDDTFKLPIVSVHCFEKFSPDEPEPSSRELHERVHARIVKEIGFPLPIESFNFHLVRKVAPTKPMFCVTFQLPEDVVFKK